LAAWRSTLTKVSTGSMHRENHGDEGKSVLSAARKESDRGRGEGIRGKERHTGAAKGNGMGNRGVGRMGHAVERARIDRLARTLHFMHVSPVVHMYAQRYTNACRMAAVF
jgi:hypothetical protein